MTAKTYDRVCYLDGWHYSVKDDGNGGEEPDVKLVLEDDGTFRAATAADTESWHDRKHASFARIEMEDGTPGLTVTADDMQAIQEFLAERKGQ